LIRRQDEGGGNAPAGSILLVEDDVDIAQMYRWRLEHAGYDVSVAQDGEEALLLAETLLYDLVLMDIGLPRRGGLEVIAQLRKAQRTENLPLVVLSNYNEPSLMKEAEKLGVIAYLVKSETTPADLAALVGGWLRC
jgi:two-component system phosphate regulon response regulator PhoB